MQMCEWIGVFLLHPSWLALHCQHNHLSLKPILISKIKQPTSQTEQYPQKGLQIFPINDIILSNQEQII